VENLAALPKHGVGLAWEKEGLDEIPGPSIDLCIQVGEARGWGSLVHEGLWGLRH
jgi:hypothetical protein